MARADRAIFANGEKLQSKREIPRRTGTCPECKIECLAGLNAELEGKPYETDRIQLEISQPSESHPLFGWCGLWAAKPRLSLAVQQWFELMGEVRNTRRVRAEPKPDGYVPDGLQAFL
jgi:hypothetical protein